MRLVRIIHWDKGFICAKNKNIILNKYGIYLINPKRKNSKCCFNYYQKKNIKICLKKDSLMKIFLVGTTFIHFNWELVLN